MQAFIVATLAQTRSRAVELRKELHPLIPRAASRQSYPRILGHTTTAVDMPTLMIEMFHISIK